MQRAPPLILSVNPIQTIHTPGEGFVPTATPECRVCRTAMDACLMLDRTHGGSEQPMWIREVERAKSDGRWKDAYDSAKSATVPGDLQVALNLNARAKAFFATLNGRNRYAILFRMQTAKKPETRARRIQMFVKMLEKHETLHP